MATQRKYNDNEVSEIYDIMAKIIVSARLVKHITWELQPQVNRLADEFGIDNKRFREWESLLFNQSEDVCEKLSAVYSSLPDYMKKSTGLFEIHPVKNAYDSVRCMESVDSYIDIEAGNCRKIIEK